MCLGLTMKTCREVVSLHAGQRFGFYLYGCRVSPSVSALIFGFHGLSSKTFVMIDQREQAFEVVKTHLRGLQPDVFTYKST